jgi:uncharacterized protein YjbJ (UPF0337 family)
VQRANGDVKEAAGTVTGDDQLRNKGKTDQTEGNRKQADEKVKDAFKN